jgi:hypothetical protein
MSNRIPIDNNKDISLNHVLNNVGVLPDRGQILHSGNNKTVRDRRKDGFLLVGLDNIIYINDKK